MYLANSASKAFLLIPFFTKSLKQFSIIETNSSFLSGLVFLVITLNTGCNTPLSKSPVTTSPILLSKRAFFNGRIDLSQVEAVIDIINAKTKT